MRKQSRLIRIGGLCGICVPIVVFTAIGIALNHSPWFEWTQHALSDLGIEGISSVFFNSGMILAGILTFIFSLGLLKMLSQKTGAYLLLFCSIALIGVGLFPETIFTVHFIVSTMFFILLALSFLIIGITLKKEGFERAMGMLAIFFTFLAISSIMFLFHWDGIAISESFSCFPAFIWFMIFGIKMAITPY